MTGEDFVTIFEKAVSDISESQKGLKNIVVIGFCFAGKLAYLCSKNSLVDTIVSFYGAGANQPGFIGEQSAIEYLVSNRGNSDLRVHSFFGIQDESIPTVDREKIQSALKAAQINYQAYEYDAGHAYFQAGRTNYNQQAAQASWQELQKII
jgi:carboxymethylenebutenolidase